MITRRNTWLAPLILVTGLTWPAFCQPVTFEIQGSAFRRSIENGCEYMFGVQSTQRYEYGTVTSDAPGFAPYLDFGNEPRVSWSARVGPDGSIEAATLDFHSAPPGASCPWPNAAGAAWVPLNFGPSIIWNPPIIPNIFANIPASRGADAAIGNATGGFTIPLRGKVDDLFLWWAGGGEGGESFCSVMQIPDVQTAYLSVSAPYLCEPYAFMHDEWILAERVDFTIRIFPVEPPQTDIDRDGAAAVPDVFMFLAEWLAGRATGDWDASGVVEIADLFAFLSDWSRERR